MPELESPTGALDLRDPSICIDIAMARPGKEIRVIVRVGDNPTAAHLMEAVGALSNDGEGFSVVVTREDLSSHLKSLPKPEDGVQQTYDLCYRDLLKALSDFC